LYNSLQILLDKRAESVSAGWCQVAANRPNKDKPKQLAQCGWQGIALELCKVDSSCWVQQRL
jgi:hypothetical protein